MNKPQHDYDGALSLPKRGDDLSSLSGHPLKFELPAMENIPGKYINTLYSPKDITVDWNSYKR